MRLLRVFLLALPIGVAACSGSALQGTVFRSGGVSFRIGELPPSWKSLDVPYARLAFRDEQSEATVLVNGRCGRDHEDISLASLTRQLFMTFTEREVLDQREVPMDGREALHTVLRAKLDGVPKMFDVYVLKKDGCVYDFVVISSPETFDANRKIFERFVNAFHAPAEGT